MMDQDKTFSLVIPTFNRAALVCQTVATALKQTVPFFEIIVVDDGSTDDTVVRLREFGDRIKLIASEKSGVQVARNLGVQAAAGDYITFSDSDDLLLPEFVAVMSEWLSAHPDYDSVYCNYQSFCGEKIENDILSAAPAGFLDGARRVGNFIEYIPDLYARTVFFQPLMPTGATVKKSFYQRIGGFNPVFNRMPSEDWEYTLRALASGKTAICALPLVRIRHHESNDSRDLLQRELGEVEILKYALQNHDAARLHRLVIEEGIQRRHRKVFYESFRKRQFGVAGLVFPHLENMPQTLPFKFKTLVMSAYLKCFKPDPDFLFRR